MVESMVMDSPISIRITPGTVFSVFIIAILFWFLFEVRHYIPIILASIIFAAAFEPGKRLLSKIRIPASVAVIIIYLIALVIGTLLIYSLVPIVISQYTAFIEAIPAFIKLLQDWIVKVGIADVINLDFADNSQAITGKLGEVFAGTGKGFLSIFNGLLNFILFLVLTFLFAVRPSGVTNVMRFFTPHKYRDYVTDLWLRTQYKMGQWFQGQLILIFVIGSITYVALTLVGIPNALFLAFVAGFLELIPLFGPILAAIPAVLIAATTGDFTTVLIVIAIYFLIQMFENYLIYPLVLTKLIGVPSVLLILAIVIGGALAGFIGIVISVPILAVLQELYADLQTGKTKEFVEKAS